MLERVEARLTEIAARARARAVKRVASTLTGAFSGITVTEEAEGVTLSARGLRRRLFDDARLRWIGMLLR